MNDGSHARFWRELMNENVDQLLESPKLLRHMRHNHDLVRRYQRRFGNIFEERNLNLYQLIANACGEVWDEEDEEKHQKSAPLGVKENAVSLDHPRQIRLRKNQGQGRNVPRCNGSSEKDVQEGGSLLSGCLRGSSEETTPEKKKQKE